jgi:TolB-like protein/Flp pilus assembly protein TadD
LTLVIFLALSAIAIFLLNPLDRGNPVQEETSRQVVAVLPFANLGDAEDEYFADGVTDEITARLSRMQGLGVISRTSASIYKGTQKPVREIGKELNADYIIEGTIRWDKSHAKGRVRITPQLIRVSDDTHVWASNYEREITEIFAVQADIAERIVEALDVTLLEGEQQTLTAQSTQNIDAYHAYLQGMKQLNSTGFSRDSFELGVQMFERAIELDPDYALAYARLSSLHSRVYHYGFDRSDRRLQMARAAVDSAFLLQPDLAEAHLALGYYYYWALRDYELALDSLARAQDHAPNNVEIMQATAYVKRRQGDLGASAELIARSLELSPLDAPAAVTLGETYGTLRQYARGEEYLKRSITLAPDDVYPYTELALLYLRWRGDAAAASAVIQEMPATGNSEYFRVGFLVALLAHDYQAALACLAACPRTVLEAGAFFIPIPLYQGMTLQLMGEAERAQAAFESASLILEEKLRQDPADYRVHSALGITCAGLGRSEDAVRHAERAVDLYPVSRDALEAPVLLIDLALTYTMAGLHEAALERLDYVLSIPSILSAPWLAQDPRWHPLRQHPEFTQLLEKYRIDPRS